MKTQTRKAIGCFALLAYLGIYAVLAAGLGVWLAGVLPNWAQLIYYAIAGIVWIFPLKPLFTWMNRQTQKPPRSGPRGGASSKRLHVIG